MSILDRVVTNQSLTEIPPIKWLLEGQSKTGKSTAAASWPAPIYLDMPAERGVWAIEGAKRLAVVKLDDVREFVEAMRGPGGAAYKTIVVDTIDALWSLVVQEFAGDKKLGIHEYGPLYQEVFFALEGIASLGKHLVMVSHVKALFEEVMVNGKKEKRLIGWVNMLPGLLSQRVAGWSDQILHAQVTAEGTYRVQCSKTATVEAGGRLKALPSHIETKLGESLYGKIQALFKASAPKPANVPGRRTMAVNPIKVKAKELGFSSETVATWLRFKGIADGILESAPDSILSELTALLQDKEKAAIAFDDARAELALSAQEQPANS